MNLKEAMTAPLIFDRLPDDALLRQGQLVSRCGSLSILPFGATTLWRKVKNGTFPQPIKLGKRIVAWRAADVRAWLTARAIESMESTIVRSRHE
jgi:predicted DNA-binding transcriptional regulator AlpA